MKLSTRQDVEAPIDAVFDMLCDFDSFERAAMRRGAEVRRLDHLSVPGVGMTWQAVFDLRDKRREVQLEIVSFDRPNEIVVHSTSPGLQGTMSFELVALARYRTRVMVALDVRPLTLSARLLMQSFKLAKGSLLGKFEMRIAEYARLIEDRHAARAGSRDATPPSDRRP